MDEAANRNQGRSGRRRNRLARGLQRALRASAVLLVGLAAASFVSHRVDRVHLRSFAERAIRGLDDPAEKVIVLLTAVKELPGTARNDRYFGWPALRATSRQVLAGGGDCADRSRLIASLLREVGIRSSLAMCFDPRTGEPTHTVVEARLVNGTRMLVDPAFGLYFPKDGGGYFGLMDVRRGGVVEQRIEQLRRERPGVDEYYLRSPAAYETVSTYNWNRGVLANGSRAVLGWWIGEGVHAFPRPVWLEEPKIMVSGLAGALAILMAMTAWFVSTGCTARLSSVSRPIDGQPAKLVDSGLLSSAPSGRS